MGKKKILFIDDDSDYTESLRMFLKEDYEVTTCCSAREGWEKIEKERPDLIVLDAMMPEKDGFALSKELKAHQEYKKIPLIMLTGVVPKISETRYSPDDILYFDGVEFIEKSAGVAEILSTLKMHLI